MLAVLHLKLEPPVRLLDHARVIAPDPPARRSKLLDAAKRGDPRAVERLKTRYGLLYWGRHITHDANVVI
jgi:hypothetical protein